MPKGGIMKRYYGIVSGQVQGVGFRNFMKLLAVTHHCTGWVRNMSNGCVEFQIQGTQDSLDLILKQIQKGNLFIKINEMSIKSIPSLMNEPSFEILSSSDISCNNH